MRKLIMIALIAIGIRAFLRWQRRRHTEHAPSASAGSPSDPADELRRKLAESREDEDAADAEQPPAASVTDRRAEVHDQGRAALDEMKPSDES